MILKRALKSKGHQYMEDTKTFAEMFEESYATPKRFSVGEKWKP